MGASGYQDSFPRGALIGGALLVGATLLFVGGMRLTHTAPMAQVPAPSQAAFTRDLKFADTDSGDVVVTAVDEPGGPHRIAVLPPGTNGFLRSVMRGLVQARKIDDIGRDQPFKLSRLRDGQLVISDPTTGRRVYLRAFGPTNVAAFAQLLDTGPDKHPRSASAAGPTGARVLLPTQSGRQTP